MGTHAAAFSTDDTKKWHIDLFKEVLDEIDDAGGFFVAGGDLNEPPPFADSTNFCDEDRCPNIDGGLNLIQRRRDLDLQTFAAAREPHLPIPTDHNQTAF